MGFIAKHFEACKERAPPNNMLIDILDENGNYKQSVATVKQYYTLLAPILQRFKVFVPGKPLCRVAFFHLDAEHEHKLSKARVKGNDAVWTPIYNKDFVRSRT